VEVAQQPVNQGSKTTFELRLAALLTELRAGRSFREFADLIGTTHTNVRQWEQGKGEPRLRVLGKIAALKGWTLDELQAHLEGESLPKNSSSVEQLMEEVRCLSFEAAAQVAAVAVETMTLKGNQV
jgi:transcriptional regulator with XRE-family HTH domain